MDRRAAAAPPPVAVAVDRRGRGRRITVAAGHDPGSAADSTGYSIYCPDDEEANPSRGVGDPRTRCSSRQHLGGPRIRAELPRRELLQPRPIPRRWPGELHVDSVWWWDPPLHRRRLRQHGDERDAAHLVARIRI